MPPQPASWRSILILPSHLGLGLPNGLFLSCLPTKTLFAPLLSLIRATLLYLLLFPSFRGTRFGNNLSHSPFCFSQYLQRAGFDATAAEAGSFGPRSRLKTSAVSPLCKSVSSQRAELTFRRRPHICLPSHRYYDNSQTSREVSPQLRPNLVTVCHQSSHSLHASFLVSTAWPT